MHDNEENLLMKPKRDRMKENVWKGQNKHNQTEVKHKHSSQNSDKPRKYNDKIHQNDEQRPTPTCWICGSKTHKPYTCPQKVSGTNSNRNQGHKAAVCHTTGSENNENRQVNIPGNGIGKIPKIAALSNNNFTEKEKFWTSRDHQ